MLLTTINPGNIIHLEYHHTKPNTWVASSSFNLKIGYIYSSFKRRNFSEFCESVDRYIAKAKEVGFDMQKVMDYYNKWVFSQ